MTAATVYRIVVPGVPDPELSPNARVHRMVKARKVRQWRETAGWAAQLVWSGDAVELLDWQAEEPGELLGEVW